MVDLSPGLGSFVRVVLVFSAVAALIQALPLLVKLAMRRRADQKLLKLGISSIDALDGRSFERLLTALFKSQGHRVLMTPFVGDGGADLVVQMGRETFVVQAKRSSRNVGVKAVQQVVASKPRYNATQAMVVTNAGYTQQAVRLAKENRVRLRDRRWLIEQINSQSLDDAA